MLPLARPGMIAAATFVLVFSWNEFLFAFIFTTTEAKTAPLILSEMLGALDGVEWGVLFAAATVQLLPILRLRDRRAEVRHRRHDRRLGEGLIMTAREGDAA